LLLFNLQYPVPIFLFADLNVGLALALFVLQRAVQQQNTRVLNSPPHLGMCDVLIKHDAVQHLTVFDLTTRDLLNASIALDVDLLLTCANLERDCPDSFESEAAHQL
jgi:hypothetical protein